MAKRSTTDSEDDICTYSWMLDQIPNNIHYVNKAAESKLLHDEHLVPGINCCSLCAGDVSPSAPGLYECPDCHQIKYCSRNCASRDEQHHSQVCPILQQIQKLEPYEVTNDNLEQALQQALHHIKDPSQLTSWSQLLPHISSLSGEAESSFCRSSPKPQQNTANSRRKRQRIEPTSSQPSSDPPAAIPPAIPTTCHNPEQAALVAAASLRLSYPLTALDSFNTIEALSDIVRRKKTYLEPLNITILGAAAAEVEHLEVWQLLQRGVGVPLRLLCVGPELPAQLHMTSQHVGHDLAVCFYKGEYQQLHELLQQQQQQQQQQEEAATAPAAAADGMVHDVEAASPAPSEQNPSQGPGAAAAAAAAAGGSRSRSRSTRSTRSGRAKPAAAAAAGTRRTRSSSRSANQRPSSPQQQQQQQQQQQGLPRDLPLLPDLYIAYHPELVNGQYTWTKALNNIKTTFQQHCAARPRPPHEPPRRLLLLASSTTHMEGLVEQEIMHAQGWGALQPPAAARFPSLLVQRSRTMGNDVFRRNSFVSLYQVVQQQRRGLLGRVRSWVMGLVGLR